MKFKNPLAGQAYNRLCGSFGDKCITAVCADIDRLETQFRLATELVETLQQQIGEAQAAIGTLDNLRAKLERENMALEDENDQLRTAMELAGLTPPPLPVVNVNPDFEKMLLAMPDIVTSDSGELDY